MNELENSSIVVVDDRPENLDVLIDFLTSFGFTILVAQNGDEAIQLVSEFVPDIILLDVIMPGLDGFETCRRLKENKLTENVPIIFMTALSDTMDKVKGFDAGGVDYIIKPFQHEEVLARVKTHLTVQKLQKQLQSQNLQLEKQNEQLRTVIQARKRIEQEVEKYRLYLEELVEERTIELSKTNEQLRAEIQERKRIAMDLQKAKEAAEVANHAKSAFLTNVSHEFRTPLNIIIGFAQLLQMDETLPANHKEDVESIEDAGYRLLSLVQDIIDMSEMEMHTLKLQEEVFQFKSMLKQLANRTQEKAAKKGLAFHASFANDLPETLRADERRIQQILENLLDNAITFTNTGSVTFKVELISVMLENGVPLRKRIRYQVEDTGVGIAKEHLTEIFFPFKQVMENTHKIDGHAGLGLAISRRLAQLMGGDLHVESVIRKGSVFWFEIDLFKHIDPSEDANKMSNAKLKPQNVFSEQEALAILELAKMHNITGIRQETARLKEKYAPLHAPLILNIEKMANNYQFNDIIELLKSFNAYSQIDDDKNVHEHNGRSDMPV
jgi:signal transduction histidine kinase